MKIRNKIKVQLLLLFFGLSAAFAGSGEGFFKIGYIAIDDDGNKAVDRETYNLYQGLELSLTNFRYLFDNGIVLNADLRSAALNNRALALGASKSGLFGVALNHSRYKRVYDFSGATNSRRNRSGGSIWVYPAKQLKLFSKLDFTDVTGQQLPVFDLGIVNPQSVNYKNELYAFGSRFNHNGRMLQAEFGIGKFKNRIDRSRDQDRSEFKLTGYYPVPRFERLVFSGQLTHFENKFVSGGPGIRSDTYQGAALMHVNSTSWIKYVGLFNRAKADSDFVDTDNLASAIYISYARAGLGGITAGYQISVNDDFDRRIEGSAYYASGWYMPWQSVELRAEYGLRIEEVASGTRLTGDREDSRYRFDLKWRPGLRYKLNFRVENKHRTNEQLGSETDFVRYSTGFEIDLFGKLNVACGYARSVGEYSNSSQIFEFDDDQIYGDISLSGEGKLIAGVSGSYNRSKRDLDLENSSLRFKAGWRFPAGYRLLASYDVYNFDDLQYRNRYFTSNVFEIDVAKSISF